jgi:hypothetical protein
MVGSADVHQIEGKRRAVRPAWVAARMARYINDLGRESRRAVGAIWNVAMRVE